MKTLDAYWLFWLLIAFLVPELLAVFKLIPLDTFSGTTAITERLHPWVQPIVFAFGVGLVAHLAYGTQFFRAMLGGAVAAIAAHLLLR